MGLNRAIGMVVEEAIRFTRPKGSVLLSGPLIGLTPEVGQPLILKGALGTAHRARCAGLLQLHRAEKPGQVAIVVTGLDDEAPARYRGSVVYEEGVIFRPFGAIQKHATQPQRLAARFELAEDRAFGFIVVAGGIVDAFVIGGGLPEGEDLWKCLNRIVTIEGSIIDPKVFKPLGNGWPVSGFHLYDRSYGEHTVILARPCGPAELGYPVLMKLDTSSIEADVLSQQVQNGLVQVEAPRVVQKLPAFLIAEPPVALGAQQPVS